MSDKCPKCGENEHSHADAWMCGSYIEMVAIRTGFDGYDEEPQFHESDQCLRRQLAQKDRELEQANKRADGAEARWERLRAAVAQGVRYYDQAEGVYHVTVSAEAMGALVSREPETGED